MSAGGRLSLARHTSNGCGVAGEDCWTDRYSTRNSFHEGTQTGCSGRLRNIVVTQVPEFTLATEIVKSPEILKLKIHDKIQSAILLSPGLALFDSWQVSLGPSAANCPHERSPPVPRVRDEIHQLRLSRTRYVEVASGASVWTFPR